MLNLFSSTVWKQPTTAAPMHVVQMIPHDGQGNILIMHRSENVRSARNCWSFPTGMHEIGQTIYDTAERELLEEYALQAVELDQLGAYENIAGDPEAKEQYHWVITVVAVRVSNLDKAINREPEKHDKFEIVPAVDLMHAGFLAHHPFHHTFQTWLGNNLKAILDASYTH